MDSTAERWRRCSTCKRDIAYDTVHWVCSVSTCNRARVELQFCSVSCWDSHVPILRHRDAWAVEARSPKRGAAPPPPPQPAARAAAPAPRPAAPPTTPQQPAPGEPRRIMAKAEDPADKEILVVVSKLKNYVRRRSGFNTSDAVMEGLSEHVRAIADRAIENARADERKTVLARDVPKLSSEP